MGWICRLITLFILLSELPLQCIFTYCQKWTELSFLYIESTVLTRNHDERFLVRKFWITNVFSCCSYRIWNEIKSRIVRPYKVPNDTVWHFSEIRNACIEMSGEQNLSGAFKGNFTSVPSMLIKLKHAFSILNIVCSCLDKTDPIERRK